MSYSAYYHYSARQSSNNASKGPSNTYICPFCKKPRSMAGKKFSHMEGRRQRFKCAVCVGEGK